MFNYKDCECSVCKKPLKETDDIVVCPECGAPYHRECYEIDKVCVHEAQHKSGYEYKKSGKQSAAPSILCPACNAKNSSENIFCESCGKPLHAGAVSTNAAPPIDNMPPPSYFTMPTINPADEIDGIPAGDWAEYIGNSAPYYLYQFKTMDIQHRKTSICWSAVLFAPLYFTYRKVWSWCAASWLIFVMAQVPSLLFMLEKSGSKYALGLNLNFLINLSNVATLILTLSQIAFGLLGVYFYRKSIGKRLKDMRRKSANPEEYHAKLSRGKGPSIIAVVASVIILTVALSVFVNYIIGADNILAMMSSFTDIAAV